MVSPAQTPQPPYFAVIFTSVRTDGDNGYGETAKQMVELAAKYEDHEIVDDQNKVVGHIRVKPSGILWSPKNGKDWYGISASAEFP